MTRRERPERWLDTQAARPGRDRDADRAARFLARVEMPRPSSSVRVRVFERLRESTHAPAQRPWAPVLLASSAVAVAIAFITLVARGPISPPAKSPGENVVGIAEVRAFSGRAVVESPATPAALVFVGQGLPSGARVRTDASGRAALRLEGVGQMELVPSTDVTLTALDRQVAVDLSQGGLLLDVSPTFPAKRLKIVAGRFTLGALAARSSIVLDGNEHVIVDVEDGEVDVEGPRAAIRVRAGERFSSRERIARNDAAAVEGLGRGAPRDAVAPPPAASPAVSSVASPGARPADARGKNISKRARGDRPARREAVQSVPAGGGEPLSASGAIGPSSASGAIGPLSASGAIEPSSASGAIEPASRARGAAPIETPPIPVAATAPSSARRAESPVLSRSASDPDRELERTYLRAKQERNVSRAIALFDEVAARPGPFAEIAGQQAARLTMRAGRCGDAVARFEGLLLKYPEGAYAHEARLNVLECHLRLGALDAAGKDLESILAHHPRTERSPELRFLRAEVSRRRGELRAAVRDYESAFGSRHDASARYLMGWCLLELGELEEGRAVLERYLAEYPDGEHARDARQALVRAPRRGDEGQ